MFVIKSSRIISGNSIHNACLLIRDGKIVDIIHAASVPADTEVYDYGDDVVMAGVIDTHVHINEPGRTEWEGFDTATRAALAGGVCNMVEMPLNASPVTTTREAFYQKLAAADGRLHSNVGFWGGVVPGNTSSIEPLVLAGVFGFKAFLTHSGIDEFPNVTESDLDKVMPVIKDAGLPLLVHCEIDSGKQDYKPTREYAAYAASRPQAWEVKAIELMIKLCRKHRCRVHIVHLSAADALPLILEAKMEGLPLTVETAQHYLYFSAESIGLGQTQFKCAPPVRESANNEKLWQALETGLIDFVATDHSPAPPSMKNLESGDFMQAWGGISSLQFALPALWNPLQKRGGSLIDISRWLCSNPSRLAGLASSKGTIGKNMDADLVIWRPEKKFEVSTGSVLHRHKLTPYIGEKLSGEVSATYLAGEKVFADGKFLQLNKGKILLK